jgi:UDP-N-acetylglucosamine 1-carboxyvinyltransferase
MDKILVHGGRKLSGTVNISGSKNSALPILAATLLTKEECVIHHVPDLSDVHYMLQILDHLGAQVERASGTVIAKAEKIQTEAPYEVVRKMRASVCVLGPLLGRERDATVSMPGGCVIGDRPIDLHLKGFEALGAAVRVVGGDVQVLAPELKGAVIPMTGKFGSTVLGTDNVMMAAVLAEGTTVIDGAAEEPEVVDLANFLIAMGAKITGAGTDRIVIDGVQRLSGVHYEVLPDRIEGGTYLVAGAITGGHVRIKNTRPEHLDAVIVKLREAGATVHTGENWVEVDMRKRRPRAVDVRTAPYPAFPTDMQAQFAALDTVADGVGTVVETIFENRFMHMLEMRRMGAEIRLEGNTAIIHGVQRLTAAPVMATDLRASASLVLAGLVADGRTEIERIYHIDRGYETIEEKLAQLGARIRRVPN